MKEFGEILVRQDRGLFHDARHDRVGNLTDLAAERARRRSPFADMR